MTIRYQQLSDELLRVVPELRWRFQAERDWWGEETPGQHVVYGDVLNPFLRSLLEHGRPRELLQRVFDFLEALANADDARVREVVVVTVCEDLRKNPALVERAKEYMGPKTRQAFKDLDEFWGPVIEE